MDVTVALALALAGGWIATRIGVSSILGYIVAGVIISPFTPGFVGDLDRLRLLADIGVVLLLFGLGVQFSIGELAQAGVRLIGATVGQTLAVFGIVAGVAGLAGSDREQALYVGAAVAISSSVVLVRMLDDHKSTDSEVGHVAISWSIVQDLTAIVLILIIGTATGTGGGRSIALEALMAGVKATAFVGGVLVIGSRAVPFVLGRVIDERSRELFFLAIAALALGTALASEYAGLSLALGAFVAGLVVSESAVSQRVLHDLLPTRDVFAVLFFVAAGMLIRPGVLLDEWLPILAVTAAIVLLKPVLAWAAFWVAGKRPDTRLMAAAFLIPAAEFSFLIADAGLGDDAITEQTFGVILASSVISIVCSPAIVAVCERRLGVGARAAPEASAAVSG